MKFVSRATPVKGAARPPDLSGWNNNEDIKWAQRRAQSRRRCSSNAGVQARWLRNVAAGQSAQLTRQSSRPSRIAADPGPTTRAATDAATRSSASSADSSASDESPPLRQTRHHIPQRDLLRADLRPAAIDVNRA